MLGIGFKKVKDQVIFASNEILKDDGKPYVVYTPYSKKWLTLFEIKPPTTDELPINPLFASHDFPFLSLTDIGFKPAMVKVPEFDISNTLLSQYPDTRNFPNLETSKVGPHLRFGTISIRKLALLAHKIGARTFLGELIWREFFMQILAHFPHTAVRSFKPEYDRIPWKNDPDNFKKWQTGQTGIPIVDAGMRELNATGFMHNRVRMITASFLCKNLLVDWRWGEAYFAMKLLDYEMASNVGNWQWAAGSGVDAAPYFRVFNPQTQAEKFDPGLHYIKKWVPELETFDYPTPIVDVKQSRELAISTYKKALS
jgi:deoxyribodipyrimidine photo-lyase